MIIKSLERKRKIYEKKNQPYTPELNVSNISNRSPL